MILMDYGNERMNNSACSLDLSAVRFGLPR